MRKLFFLFLAVFLSPHLLFAQNYGFEAPAATPPTGWSAVTGTWNTINSSTNPTGVRSGKHAMSINLVRTDIFDYVENIMIIHEINNLNLNDCPFT
jgi:hypothetical protein